MCKVCRNCSVAKRELGKSSAEYGIWFEGHRKDCDVNHYGSSTSMEIEAALILRERSQEMGFRYSTLLSDGDLKSSCRAGIVVSKAGCICVGLGLNPGEAMEWPINATTESYHSTSPELDSISNEITDEFKDLSLTSSTHTSRPGMPQDLTCEMRLSLTHKLSASSSLAEPATSSYIIPDRYHDQVTRDSCQPRLHHQSSVTAASMPDSKETFVS
ncbi:uncharacterized protein TNCV_3889081 [Trichonephila clavipes]|nr:uncharacterized protein TNCV_3889081 [Trichonephila clavipes]